jgi:hypothetical protein
MDLGFPDYAKAARYRAFVHRLQCSEEQQVPGTLPAS